MRSSNCFYVYRKSPTYTDDDRRENNTRRKLFSNTSYFILFLKAYMPERKKRMSAISFLNNYRIFNINGNIYCVSPRREFINYRIVSIDDFILNMRYGSSRVSDLKNSAFGEVMNLPYDYSVQYFSNNKSEFIAYNGTLYHANNDIQSEGKDAEKFISMFRDFEITNEAAIFYVNGTSSWNRSEVIFDWEDVGENGLLNTLNEKLKTINVKPIENVATVNYVGPVINIFPTSNTSLAAETAPNKCILLTYENIPNYETYDVGKCELTNTWYHGYGYKSLLGLDGEYHTVSNIASSEIGWTGKYKFRSKYEAKALEMFGGYGYGFCRVCGNAFIIKDSDILNSSLSVLCENCTEEGYRICADCGTAFISSDISLINDKWYCDECNPKITVLKMNSYGYKPAPMFVNDDGSYTSSPSNKVYAGVELEVGDCSSNKVLRREVGCSLPDNDRIYIYAKHDGSLCDEGVEFVTHPMSERFHIDSDFWDNVCSGIEAAEGTNDGAGLHIHISRGPLSYEQQCRIIYFANKYKAFFKDFSRRNHHEFGDWCAFRSYNNIINDTVTKAQKAKQIEEDDGNRYQCVNDTNLNTLEFRFFKAFYEPEWIKSCIDMVFAIVKLAKSVPDNEEFDKTPDDLYEYFTFWKTKEYADNCTDRHATDFTCPVKITDYSSLELFNNYKLKSIPQSSIHSPTYNRSVYNHEWYAYRWVNEHPLSTATLIAKYTDDDGNKYYAFHTNSRLSTYERWTSHDEYDRKFASEITANAESCNWDKSARIIILHESEFRAFEFEGGGTVAARRTFTAHANESNDSVGYVSNVDAVYSGPFTF